ncbi:hypothetical protein PBI_GAIA_54 [Mycobacterium phage Gaia]|uniref:Uncharacterized protein n=1 Tax=Mycobacterium phage Gaia TaxID=1486472 RepID=A0A068F3F7_9CAUD|nr:hypothetical protein VC46_gp179 [Mycobacterium phage Gaia]AID58873.1 hypothetical protein PBI_GAIA_54 [Mycobacterium phage Gaia]AYR00109.1 hypothetical protein PBI_NEBKISS_58 [Mycobacterium phage Nebkiss]
MTIHDGITEVLRREGWTCEYHEPVGHAGECSQCDGSHRRTADTIVETLGLTAEYAVQYERERPERIDVQVQTVEQIVSRDVAQIAVQNGLPTSGRGHRAVTRYVTKWVPDA